MESRHLRKTGQICGHSMAFVSQHNGELTTGNDRLIFLKRE